MNESSQKWSPIDETLTPAAADLSKIVQQPLKMSESKFSTAAHHRGSQTAAASRRLQSVRATQPVSAALASQGGWQGWCGSLLLLELPVQLRPLRSVSRFEIYLTCMLRAARNTNWDQNELLRLGCWPATHETRSFFALLCANGFRSPKTTTENHSPTPLNYPLTFRLKPPQILSPQITIHDRKFR